MSQTTDIDEAQANDPERLRQALLDQLAYLTEEVEALETVVDGLPDQIKTGRPGPDTLTMKETYGALATLDGDVRLPRIQRILAEDEPLLEAVDLHQKVRDAGWNEMDMETILDQVHERRRALVDELQALPLAAWHRTATLDGETVTCFDLVHRVTQNDATRLRDLGYRLHGAHLSDRDEPLPT